MTAMTSSAKIKHGAHRGYIFPHFAVLTMEDKHFKRWLGVFSPTSTFHEENVSFELKVWDEEQTLAGVKTQLESSIREKLAKVALHALGIVHGNEDEKAIVVMDARQEEEEEKEDLEWSELKKLGIAETVCLSTVLDAQHQHSLDEIEKEELDLEWSDELKENSIAEMIRMSFGIDKQTAATNVYAEKVEEMLKNKQTRFLRIVWKSGPDGGGFRNFYLVFGRNKE